MFMTNEQHAKVLHQYIASIPLTQLKAMVQASEKCLDASMNLGSRAQNIYAQDEARAIRNAVDAMTLADLNAASRIITQVAK